MGARLMAIVAEGDADESTCRRLGGMEAVALKAKPTWKPDVDDLRQHAVTLGVKPTA